MNNSYITIIKEKRTVLSRKRVPLNQNECTADFRIGVPFEQNLHNNILYPPKIKKILISDNILLDLQHHVVYRNNEQIPLTKIEFSLLQYFIENKEHVLSKKSILNYIWDYNGKFVDENAVTVNIRRLRMKIEENPSSPKHIISIRGVGYKWQ